MMQSQYVNPVVADKLRKVLPLVPGKTNWHYLPNGQRVLVGQDYVFANSPYGPCELDLGGERPLIIFPWISGILSRYVWLPEGGLA